MSKTILVGCVSAAALAAAGGAQAGTLFIANMTQSQEVPPTGVSFTGRGVVILNNAETSATVFASTDIPNNQLSNGHIHRAPAGVNGPIIFPFPGPVTNSVGPLTWAIPAADVTNLKNEGLYFNFHTTTFTGGAIRGQIRRFLFAPSAVNANEAAVAGALDVSAGNNADLDQVLINLAFAPVETRTQALEELSARTVYTQARAANEAMADFQSDLLTRARVGAGRGLFVSAGDGFGRRDTSPSQAGSKISRPFIQGGVDLDLGGVYAGVAVGYADGKDTFKNGGGETKAKTTSLQAFAGGGETVRWTAAAGYGWTDYRTTRNLTAVTRTAKSSHNGNAWALAARVEAPMPLSGALSIAPYGQLAAQHASVDAYAEEDAGAAGLVVPKRTESTVAGEAGATVVIPLTGETSGATARLQAGYRVLLDDGHDRFAAALVGSPTTFETEVLSPGRSAAHLAFSLDAKLGEKLIASAGYQGEISKRQDVHSVRLRLSMPL